jgi:hypothetical protein
MRFDELFNKHEPVSPEADTGEKATDEKTTQEGAETDDKAAGESRRVLPPSTFGRGKGTVFLVARKSRSVVWSAFQTPKATTPEGLDEVAGRLVKQLKRDLAVK